MAQTGMMSVMLNMYKMLNLEEELVEVELKLLFLIEHPVLSSQYPREFDVIYDRLVDRYLILLQNRKV